ncbi:serine hydrolase [Streptomyces parvulus]|nr:serine hydrolase [Streptomyces parvulus]
MPSSFPGGGELSTPRLRSDTRSGPGSTPSSCAGSSRRCTASPPGSGPGRRGPSSPSGAGRCSPWRRRRAGPCATRATTRAPTRAWNCPSAPGADEHRHALRPRVPDEGVHGGRRRPADRAGHARHRRGGRGVPAGLPGRGGARRHGAAAADAHLRAAARTAAVRLRRRRGAAAAAAGGAAGGGAGYVLLLGPEHAAPPAGPGTHHRPHARRPRPRRDHPAAGHDGHALRAVPGGGGHGGPAAPLGQGGPGDAARVVHDENAWALGGVAGHAGLFSTARDLAVFCRALLAGGSYGPARILGPDFVELLLAEPGLGFALDQPWFMGELAGRGAAGHTGFTGTMLVLDRATDTFAVLLANTVHPRRRPPDNAPRAALGTRVARAVRGI